MAPCGALPIFVSVLQLQQVYQEIYRVLKPGSYFASYEWVSTKEYDPNNKDHVRIMDEINYGNGLPVRVDAHALYVAACNLVPNVSGCLVPLLTAANAPDVRPPWCFISQHWDVAL